MNQHTQAIWHILGAGAIGCLWASHLARCNRQVHLILSPRHAMPADGKLKLDLQTPEGHRHNVTINASTAQQLTSSVNNLIVCTKATQVLHALASVRGHFVAGARIVLLLNGMGFQQAVLEAHSECKLFAAVTTDGAWLKRPFDVVQAGTGMTTLGALGASAADTTALLEDLQNPGLQLITTTEIETALLEKVMINAAINGLTAVHDCRNGGLLQLPAAHSQLQQVVEELQRVLVAASETQLAERLPFAVDRVIRQTANNYSSTYQDIKHQRPTEIDFINGYVCQIGSDLGVPTPRNQEIVTAINALAG